MKILNIARVGALVICLTILTGASISAQNTNTGPGTAPVQTTPVQRDDDTDWGWLGLLGLLGLAGLLGRKRDVHVRDNRDVRDNRTAAR